MTPCETRPSRSQTNSRDFPPYQLATLDETTALAHKLVPFLRKHDVLLLKGDLGSGKTTFVRFLFKKLGVRETITSPTFALRASYEGSFGTLNHFDLYRIKEEQELEELGWYEALASDLTVVEWAERLSSYHPKDCLTLHFSGAASERVCRILAQGSWVERIDTAGFYDKGA